MSRPTEDETAVIERPSQGDAVSTPGTTIREEPSALLSNRYVVLEEVGRGAMGRVMRAYDSKLQREVALKGSVEPERGGRGRRGGTAGHNAAGVAVVAA